MKILMTADTVGGVWTYAMELTRALAPHGVDVALATMGAKLTTQQWREANARPNVTVYESAFKLEWMPDSWSDVDRAGDWLLGIASRERPDAVHLNGYAHASLAWPCPVVVAGHSCVLSWHAAVRNASPGGEWREYARRAQAGLRAAAVVVAPTRAMLDALELHYGALRRTRVILNGRTAPAGERPVKEPLILSAGRLWDEAKNVTALDRVAQHLSWPVYVAGELASSGAGHSVGRTLTCALPLGHLSARALSEWLARASIYALPARYEPFGLSVLEAALAGCALLLSDIPSLRELWSGAALFVPLDDDDALLTAARRLIDDERLRGRLAESALERARMLDAERMAASYLSLYRALRQCPPRMHVAPRAERSARAGGHGFGQEGACAS